MELAQNLKAVPDMRKYNIIPPDFEYDYFRDARDFPFESNSRELNWKNLWWLSDASFLAYAPPRFIQYALECRAGLDEFRFFQGKTTEAFVGSNKKVAIVAFRGTEVFSFNAVFDLITDIRMRLVSFYNNTKVHQGFKEALEENWDGEQGIKQYLDCLKKNNPRIKFWFTGHSLGGAMATLAAYIYPDVQGLVTIGSPRVGNKDFADSFKVPYWRIIHNDDIVSYLPPKNPLSLDGSNSYTHTGVRIFISGNGEIKVLDEDDPPKARKTNPGDGSIFNVLKAKFNTMIDSLEKMDWNVLRNLAQETGDHAPIFYSVKLWNHLLRQEDLKSKKK